MTAARTDQTADTRNGPAMPSTPHTAQSTDTTPTTGDIVDATTAGADPTRADHRPGGNNGILTAARLNLVGVGQRLGMPWVVGAVAFAITIVIYALVAGTTPDSDDGVTGALASLFVTVAIGYLQTMTQSFGFALSLGVTRRNFYLGVGLLVLLESLLNAVLLTAFRVIEDATGGWGLGMHFFGVPLVAQDNLFAQVLVYGAILAMLSALALLVGTVFKRWAQIGLYVAGIGTTLVLAALVLLATWLGAWSAIGAFLAAVPAVVLLGVVPLVVAVLSGGLGYLLVRRATP